PERPGRDAFYDLDGRSLKKSFLKSPLEFTRITSGFTYARPHPILGGVRPHLAIDYAAPVGTPVRAVADGVVTAAGWDGGNGVSVTIRHRSGYATMYNHLSKIDAGVRRGVRVRQRQVIGYVGATGLATGPHLDYRVSKHGQFVNPLSERFIPGEPIGAAITSWRTAYASLRERRTTGRRPAGGGRSAHQTSPRRITSRCWRGVARQRPRPPSPHGGSRAGGDSPPRTRARARSAPARGASAGAHPGRRRSGSVGVSSVSSRSSDRGRPEY